MQLVSKRKQSIAPKITHTKTTISKSTPFFIRKHHLDDTQMRSVLNYDHQTVKNNHQRTYSYKGEVLSCVSSKIKEPFQTFQNRSNQISRPPEKLKIQEYYPEKYDKIVQVQSLPKTTKVSGNDQSTLKWSKKVDQKKSIERNAGNQYRQNDYGLQQAKHLKEARKKLQKQAEKLRGLYKRNMKNNIEKQDSKQKVAQLQDQIRQLKIKNYEIQKNILTEQYIHKTQQSLKPGNSNKQSREKPLSILTKPRFKIKHNNNDDTDSSFSSFELQ